MTARNLLIYLVAALFIAACSGNQTDTDFVEQAKTHLDQNELRPASIQLKNALQQNPDNPEARWLLGKVHLEMGNPAAADKELRRALELGVSEQSIRPLVARALAAQSKYEEVLALAADGLVPAAQAEILAVQAEVLLAQDKPDQAEEKINQALAIQPNDAAALTEQARLAVVRSDIPGAKELLNNLLKDNEEYATAWSLLGEIERREQRLEQAETALGKAVEYRFNDTADRLKRALVRIELGNYDAAQSDIDLLKRRIPEYYELHYAQGLLHFVQQQYRQAQVAFERAYEANDKFQAALFYLSATHHYLGQQQQAENLASRFVAANPRYVPGRKLLAEIRLREGNFTEVERLLRPVVQADDKDVGALNLLAMSLIQQGKTQAGITMLERVVSLQPESTDAYLRLGSGLLKQGKESEGLQTLATAIELDPETRDTADTLVIRHYLQKNQFDKALARANAYVERSPEQSNAHNLRGIVQLARGETDAAKSAFEAAIQQSPGDITANQNLAALALNNQDYATARRHYEAILSQHEDHLDTLMKLAIVDERQQRNDAMIKHLEQAIAAHPQAVQPRTSLARHYLGRGEPEKVTVALGDLQQTRFDHPEVVEVLGRAQLAQRAGAEAQATFDRLIELQPESAEAHYLMGLAYAQLDDLTSLKAELEKSISLDKAHLAARLAKTRLLLLDRDIDAARKQLATLNTIAPAGHPDVKYLEARVASLSGEEEKALEIYNELFEEIPSATHMLAVVQQKWEMGDRSGTITLLEQWLDEHPQNLAAHLRLANAYSSTGQHDSAAEQYKLILERFPENLIALNNLAWQLKESAPNQALEYIEKANTIAPDAISIRDTMAVVLMKNGQHERALRMSQALVEQHPDTPSFAYHRAMILAEAGRNAEAVSLLTKLLDKHAAFGERDAAEQLLQRLQNT